MKKVLLILFVLGLSACVKQGVDGPTPNKPQESLNESKVVGIVRKNELKDEMIESIKENYLAYNWYKFDHFDHFEVFDIDLNNENYIYTTIATYLYKDSKWNEYSVIYLDDRNEVKYLLMDFDIDLINVNYSKNLNFFGLDKDKELSFATNTEIDKTEFVKDILVSVDSFLDSEAELYKEREVILYEAIGSNDDEYNAIHSKYFDEFLAQDDLNYESGILVTLKVSDERPKEISPEIMVKDVEGLREYIKIRGENYLSWQDFKHLEHENVSDDNEMIVEIYELEDAELKLIGASYDEKPNKIILIQDSKEITIKD